MRVDNRVAERRPQHNEPLERERHRTQAGVTGMRHAHTSLCLWIGPPGTQQSFRWRWCEGRAR